MPSCVYSPASNGQSIIVLTQSRGKHLSESPRLFCSSKARFIQYIYICIYLHWIKLRRARRLYTRSTRPHTIWINNNIYIYICVYIFSTSNKIRNTLRKKKYRKNARAATHAFVDPRQSASRVGTFQIYIFRQIVFAHSWRTPPGFSYTSWPSVDLRASVLSALFFVFFFVQASVLVCLMVQCMSVCFTYSIQGRFCGLCRNSKECVVCPVINIIKSWREKSENADIEYFRILCGLFVYIAICGWEFKKNRSQVHRMHTEVQCDVMVRIISK